MKTKILYILCILFFGHYVMAQSTTILNGDFENCFDPSHTLCNVLPNNQGQIGFLLGNWSSLSTSDWYKNE